MKNKGISLITLVITIIIMIILAGAIILTLTNSGIFDKANEAVGKYNLKEVQAMADLAWAEAYDEDVTLDELKAAVNKVLEDNELDELYKAEVTEKGVTITENKPVEVPADWKSNVSTIVDGVPIPKGFVASPYDGTDGMPAENTKAGGLVIYALNEGETSIPATETHQTSLENRNQFVWVPVKPEEFKTKFVRSNNGWKDSSGNDKYTLSPTLGTNYWELVLTAENKVSQNTTTDNIDDYVSATTLQEATAMYASVEKYGGFYIARYEVGYSYDEEDNKVPSITMGKYPYNNVIWSTNMIEEDDDGCAVDLARKFYPNTSDNTTGVVSTLTYGVQWDTTLNWWTGKDLTNSTSYGNYYDTAISSDEYNANAKYSKDDGYSWNDAVAKGDGNYWLLTTGAFKNASVNNIYDMAGNLSEWTMEGCSSDYRVNRGGCFALSGDNYIPVIDRNRVNPDWEYNSTYGFRPSLYIKK